MKCNICQSTDFIDAGTRKKVLCNNCKSYERTRVFKLILDRMDIKKDTRILHIAPEKGLANHLQSLSNHCVLADIASVRFGTKMYELDLCRPETYPQEKFDIVIHSHVIEHIRCNYTAALVRLHKMLNPGGTHLMCIPIYSTCYSEHLGQLSDEEATQRFGQHDHVRRFSAVDIDTTLGAIFRLPKEYNLLNRFTEAELLEANVPEATWHGWTPHSVLDLNPEDLLL